MRCFFVHSNFTATLSQDLEISKCNQDHLATFLGHDYVFTEVSNLVFYAQSTIPVISGRNVDINTYCQPVEVVQKAEVASVLLKVNEGVKVGDACHGSVEEETITQGSDGGGNSDSDSEYHDLPSSSPHHNDKVSSSTSHSENRVTSSLSCLKGKSKKSQVKRPWSGEEPAAVQRHLASCLILNAPKEHTCERALSAEPDLRKRTLKDIKYLLKNG